MYEYDAFVSLCLFCSSSSLAELFHQPAAAEKNSASQNFSQIFLLANRVVEKKSGCQVYTIVNYLLTTLQVTIIHQLVIFFIESCLSEFIVTTVISNLVYS